MRMLNIALPKGRLGEKVYDIFESAGYDCPSLREPNRKLIFENATLCSQFLREYTGIEALKHVRPEDIEDMTERFVPMFTEERNSDVVKRVHLSDEKLDEVYQAFLRLADSKFRIGQAV